MGAGGSTKTQPGMGGQTAGRPMTPFSPDGGAQMGGMQGFNTGMGGMGGPSGQVGNLGQMAGMIKGSGQMQQAPGYGGGLGGFTQSGAMSGGFDPSQLSRMSSMIQGGGQMPQGQIPQALTPFSMAGMDRQAQQGPMPQMQIPQSMLPFQQSQGMAPQPPMTQSPMQQGLGGLGAYMGGGG